MICDASSDNLRSVSRNVGGRSAKINRGESLCTARSYLFSDKIDMFFLCSNVASVSIRLETGREGGQLITTIAT